MKSLILVLLFSALSFFSYAQDSVKIERTEEYVLVIATAKPFSTKVNIALDYGQERSLFSGSHYVRGDDGKLATFNSIVDALNYMNGAGWEFINAYPVTTQGNTTVYHYLMKRRIKI